MCRSNMRFQIWFSLMLYSKYLNKYTVRHKYQFIAWKTSKKTTICILISQLVCTQTLMLTLSKAFSTRYHAHNMLSKSFNMSTPYQRSSSCINNTWLPQKSIPIRTVYKWKQFIFSRIICLPRTDKPRVSRHENQHQTNYKVA